MNLKKGAFKNTTKSIETIKPDQYRLSANLFYLGICGSANIFGIEKVVETQSTQS